ncbi:MAG: UDP-N-acetylmuramoyl-L-alanyl-D-glutamate--2,6-diaminopimelate ligase, partial [Clostridia bacterium]|nr:UDP-N-acetylmuramoyl-L-alanyl-D-glutamate--2,6-diaminopimelate ligase [Clostridia bacterium]
SEFGARFAVWNADDNAFEEMRKVSGAREHVTCSLSSPAAALSASELRPIKTQQALGVSFVLKHQEEAYPVYLPLAGACNAMNAMEALAVATHCFAIPLPKAIHALESVAVKGRSEYIPLPHGVCAVIDYAHNGESLRQILSSLRPYTSGRLCCLFGSVGERSQLRRRELGAAAAALSDLAILTSDNPGREDPDQIIAEIEEAFLPTDTPYIKIPDRKEAITYALRQLAPDDILLIAGKGQEEYQLIGTKKLPFSEREIVEDYALAASAAITK